jgi:hypothetical protein
VEPDQLLGFAADVCQRLGLTYLVVGSTATIAYGEPRFTNDIDIAIELPPLQVDPFCDSFPAPEFYLSRDTVRDAVRRCRPFNLIHPASGLKIDFMVLTQSAFDRARIARRRELPVLQGRTISFASPEDVILKKLLFFQEGGSEKHLRDIAGVLRVQGERIDRGYIHHWAGQLGVLQVWEQILNPPAAGSESE